MAMQHGTIIPALSKARPSGISKVYREGIIGGMVGAATIAIWFLILDMVGGRPLYTPTVLGTALFRGGDLASLNSLPVSLEMTFLYTWVHGAAFCAIGALAARLLALAETNPNIGFGVLLFFVILSYGFLAAQMLFAQPILHAFSWFAVFIGNLLAAVTMTAYFWRRHPNLIVRP